MIRKFSTNFEIIAGPCAAESEEQLNSTAKHIRALDKRVSFFRAGVWKPRTRPNTFEGHGNIALPWLYNAAVKHNMIPITEVASRCHVNEAINAGITTFWVGARTTCNPFSVQVLVNSFLDNIDKGKIKEEDLYIFVKNPIAADYDLWLGAIERFTSVGFTGIGAIFRGTYFTKPERDASSKSVNMYRNNPSVEMLEKLSKELPDMSLIIDPSHIVGKNGKLLNDAVKTFCELPYINGLMLETHYNPNEAITDRNQQITPEELKQLSQYWTRK